jgi:outer membrane protein insertion porin family
MYSMGLSIYKRDFQYIDYTQDTFGGSLNVGRQFLRHFYGSIGAGYVDNKSTYNEDYQPADSINVNFYNDQYSKASGFLSVKFDNTDDFYLPRQGFIAAVNAEYADLNGDMQQINIDRGYTEFDDYTRVNGRFGVFYGLNDWIDYDMILRFKVRGTKIVSQKDEYIPIAERMFMGGIGTVRGYNVYSISPRVIEEQLPNGKSIARQATDADAFGDRIGGTQRASGTIEASVPLSEAAKMRLAFFYDYGIIGTDPVRRDTGLPPIEFDNIARSSTGVVLEWNSAFGPINLVFAYPIDEQIWDNTAVFEFSMGTKF